MLCHFAVIAAIALVAHAAIFPLGNAIITQTFVNGVGQRVVYPQVAPIITARVRSALLNAMANYAEHTPDCDARAREMPGLGNLNCYKPDATAGESFCAQDIYDGWAYPIECQTCQELHPGCYCPGPNWATCAALVNAGQCDSEGFWNCAFCLQQTFIVAEFDGGDAVVPSIDLSEFKIEILDNAQLRFTGNVSATIQVPIAVSEATSVATWALNTAQEAKCHRQVVVCGGESGFATIATNAAYDFVVSLQVTEFERLALVAVGPPTFVTTTNVESGCSVDHMTSWVSKAKAGAVEAVGTAVTNVLASTIELFTAEIQNAIPEMYQPFPNVGGLILFESISSEMSSYILFEMNTEIVIFANITNITYTPNCEPQLVPTTDWEAYLDTPPSQQLLSGARVSSSLITAMLWYAYLNRTFDVDSNTTVLDATLHAMTDLGQAYVSVLPTGSLLLSVPSGNISATCVRTSQISYASPQPYLNATMANLVATGELLLATDPVLGFYANLTEWNMGPDEPFIDVRAPDNVWPKSVLRSAILAAMNQSISGIDNGLSASVFDLPPIANQLLIRPVMQVIPQPSPVPQTCKVNVSHGYVQLLSTCAELPSADQLAYGCYTVPPTPPPPTPSYNRPFFATFRVTWTFSLYGTLAQKDACRVDAQPSLETRQAFVSFRDVHQCLYVGQINGSSFYMALNVSDLSYSTFSSFCRPGCGTCDVAGHIDTCLWSGGSASLPAVSLSSSLLPLPLNLSATPPPPFCWPQPLLEPNGTLPTDGDEFVIASYTQSNSCSSDDDPRSVKRVWLGWLPPGGTRCLPNALGGVTMYARAFSEGIVTMKSACTNCSSHAVCSSVPVQTTIGNCTAPNPEFFTSSFRIEVAEASSAICPLPPPAPSGAQQWVQQYELATVHGYGAAAGITITLIVVTLLVSKFVKFDCLGSFESLFVKFGEVLLITLGPVIMAVQRLLFTRSEASSPLQRFAERRHAGQMFYCGLSCVLLYYAWEYGDPFGRISEHTAADLGIPGAVDLSPLITFFAKWRSIGSATSLILAVLCFIVGTLPNALRSVREDSYFVIGPPEVWEKVRCFTVAVVGIAMFFSFALPPILFAKADRAVLLKKTHHGMLDNPQNHHDLELVMSASLSTLSLPLTLYVVMYCTSAVATGSYIGVALRVHHPDLTAIEEQGRRTFGAMLHLLVASMTPFVELLVVITEFRSVSESKLWMSLWALHGISSIASVAVLPKALSLHRPGIVAFHVLVNLALVAAASTVSTLFTETPLFYLAVHFATVGIVATLVDNVRLTVAIVENREDAIEDSTSAASPADNGAAESCVETPRASVKPSQGNTDDTQSLAHSKSSRAARRAKRVYRVFHRNVSRIVLLRFLFEVSERNSHTKYGLRCLGRRLCLLISMVFGTILTVDSFVALWSSNPRHAFDQVAVRHNVNITDGEPLPIDPVFSLFKRATIVEVIFQLLGMACTIIAFVIDSWKPSRKALAVSRVFVIAAFLLFSLSVIAVAWPDYVAASHVEELFPPCAPRFDSAVHWLLRTLVGLYFSAQVMSRTLPILTVYPPAAERIIEFLVTGEYAKEHVFLSTLKRMTAMLTPLLISFPLIVISMLFDDDLLKALACVCMVCLPCVAFLTAILDTSKGWVRTVLALTFVLGYWGPWILVIHRASQLSGTVNDYVTSSLRSWQFYFGFVTEIALSTITLADVMSAVMDGQLLIPNAPQANSVA